MSEPVPSPQASAEGAMGTMLKIGQVAERVGLSLRTLRYYEEVGLLEPTDRTAGGFRLYTEADVAHLLFLKGMKPFGLTLEEVRDLVGLLHEERPSAEDRTALEGYLERAHERVEQLEREKVEVLRVRDAISAHLRASPPRRG